MALFKQIKPPSRPTRIKVGLAQIAPLLGNIEQNLARHLEIIKQARSRSIDLLLFPELSLTGYFLKDMVSEVSLTVDDNRLAPLAEATGAMDLVVGLVEESTDHRFYNSAFYYSDGSLIATHRKVYLPTYGMFDEQRYFSSGSSVRAFDTRFGRVGLLICEDLWHSALPYILTLDGALILIAVSSSPARGIDGGDRPENTRSVERLHRFYAKMHSLFVLSVNRVGYEDGVAFWGGSEVVGPDGEVQSKAPYFEDSLSCVEIDLLDLRRERVFTPLMRDEDLDLTVRELLRIRDEREE